MKAFYHIIKNPHEQRSTERLVVLVLFSPEDRDDLIYVEQEPTLSLKWGQMTLTDQSKGWLANTNTGKMTYPGNQLRRILYGEGVGGSTSEKAFTIAQRDGRMRLFLYETKVVHLDRRSKPTLVIQRNNEDDELRPLTMNSLRGPSRCTAEDWDRWLMYKLGNKGIWSEMRRLTQKVTQPFFRGIRSSMRWFCDEFRQHRWVSMASLFLVALAFVVSTGITVLEKWEPLHKSIQEHVLKSSSTTQRS